MIFRSFFKALVVDDEQNGRDQLSYHINRHEDIQIIGNVSSVDEALEIVKRDQPDIIFLDIEMPNKNGFELIKEMNGVKPSPCVVFVTAYDHYAIHAIKQSALDYILKPVARDEFDEVLEKFRQKASEMDIQEGMANLLNQLEKPEKLRFNQKGKTIFIDPDEIIYCKADGNYTEIHLDENHKETITHHLKHVHAMLNSDFQRLGRSLIINKKYLAAIDRADKSLTFRKHDQELTISLTNRLLHEL